MQPCGNPNFAARRWYVLNLSVPDGCPSKSSIPYAPTNGRAQLYRVASAVAHQAKLHPLRARLGLTRPSRHARVPA